jgi:GT2 family glycosyltransferase
VLRELLACCGVSTPGRPARPGALADDLPLSVERRRPLRLPADVHARIVAAPAPFGPRAPAPEAPFASVVVVSHGSEALTRLCVESVLADADAPAFELIVVDNGSADGSRAYLQTIARRFPHVTLLLNAGNHGFAAACNQGLACARGELLVLLNNDAIVPAGWLRRLAAHASEPQVGLIGAVTNRIGNEAEVPVAYETYGGFLAEAAQRAREHAGRRFELPMPAMFCLALRRDAYDRLGPLDEGFGAGTLEDDDYAERARRAGLRLVCAEDVLVHHFGEGSLGELFADGSHGELLAANRARFERKWDIAWQPYGRRHTAEYEQVRERVRELVAGLPPDGAVIVASRGDEEILRFEDRPGWHFPQGPDGVYAGCYPADGAQAVAELERLRERGGRWFLLPRTSLWWLEHYRELRAHLSERYREIVREEACVMYSLEEAR